MLFLGVMRRRKPWWCWLRWEEQEQEQGGNNKVHWVPVNLLLSVLAIMNALVLQQLQQGDTSDIDTRPERNRAIPMFTHNVAMNILRIHLETIRQDPTESGRIQIGTRPNHAIRRKSWEPPRDVSQSIDGVGNDQQNGVGTVLGELRNDLLEERNVAFHECQPRLAFPLSCTRGNDADVGFGCDGVIRVRNYLGSRQKCCRML